MPTTNRPRRASSATGGIKRPTTSGGAGGMGSSAGGSPVPGPTAALRRTKTAESMDRRKFRVAATSSGSSKRGESPSGGGDSSAAVKKKRGKSSDGSVIWRRSNHGASKSPNRRVSAFRSVSDGTIRSTKGVGFGGVGGVGMMSASVPGQSVRRTTSPPEEQLSDDPRERAMSIMDRIEKRRGSDASELSLGDSMNLSSSQGRGTMTSQSVPGGTTRGRTMSTKGTYSTSFHSSVARRFIEHDDSDDSDEFELKASSLMGMGKYSTKTTTSGTNPTSGAGNKSQPRDSLNDSWMGRLSDSLHSLTGGIGDATSRISLNFGGSDGDNDDDDDDDEMHDLDGSESSEQEIFFEKSLFSNRLRQDLTEVDQSVNLMNAEAAKYEMSNRGNRKRGLHKNRNNGAMVEMFLNERSHSSPAGGGAGQRKGFCDRGFLCLLFVFILMVATGFLVSPYVADLEFSSIFERSRAAASTSSPTEAPETKPTPINDESESNTETNTTPEPLLPEDVVDSLNSPYYEPDIIELRELALEELLSKAEEAAMGGRGSASSLITKTAAARKANEWIVAYDPAQMEFDDNDKDTDNTKSVEILQRYALAVLFFVSHPNVEPGTAPHEIISTRQQQSYRASTASNSNNNHKKEDKGENRHLSSHLTFVDWMTATNVCWWEGLRCNNSRDGLVTDIHLSEARMIGTLPPELGLLTSLTHIDFSHNRLHKQVPTQYAKSLTNLESLHLYDNEFTGTVSTDFCQLDHLDTFITDCQTTDMECECCSECL